jgi:hypothetical protein
MALRAKLVSSVAVLALVLAGCKKQAPVSNTAPAAADQNAASTETTKAGVAPLDATPVVVPAPEDGNMTVVLAELSRQLRKYVLVSRSAPKSFEEFADKARVQAPPPPTGQKYAIDHGEIVLVKR